jgi:pimeloyl-ACP methyl ester carboxylesterase
MKERASTGRIVLVVLAVLLGVSAGLGTLLGAAALTNRPPLFLLAGLAGFCAFYLLVLLFATHKVGQNRRRRVRELSIPTLVIKGRCDYLSWSSAQEYLNALPNAKLLYLKDFGHNAYQDEPDRYMANVRAFLLSRPLPEHPYEGSKPPEGYEGPP